MDLRDLFFVSTLADFFPGVDSLNFHKASLTNSALIYCLYPSFQDYHLFAIPATLPAQLSHQILLSEFTSWS